MSIIGSFIDAGASVYNTERTIKANKEMAEYAYSKDLEMWERQNEYNTPAAQMQRFSDAGLNPNLIYGQGTSGNAVQLPKYQAPNLESKYHTDAVGAIGAYFDNRVKKASVDNLKAQNENIHTQNENLKSQTAYTNQNTLNRIAELAKTISETRMSDTKRSQLEGLFELQKHSLETQIKKTDADIQHIGFANFKIAADIERIGYQNRLTNEQIAQTQQATLKLMQEVTNASIQGQILNSSAYIKDLEADLAATGVMPGSSMSKTTVNYFMLWLRKLDRALGTTINVK